MSRAFSRRVAALFLAAGFAATALSPASAETLNIPVESHIRPIATAVPFSQMFANLFPESDGTTYVRTGDSSGDAVHIFGAIQRDAKNILATFTKPSVTDATTSWTTPIFPTSRRCPISAGARPTIRCISTRDGSP